MATESITFPEDEIPAIIRIIKKGLIGEKNKDLRVQLIMQCDELEEYWGSLKED